MKTCSNCHILTADSNCRKKFVTISDIYGKKKMRDGYKNIFQIGSI